MLTAAENIVLPLKLAGGKPDQAWLDELIDKVGLGDRLDAPPVGALRRPAAARRRRPRARLAAERDVRRRADRQPRLHAPAARSSALLRDSVDTLGQTTVMVTHDAHAAAIADRVLFLADGEIVRDLGPSTAHEILDDAGGGDRAMIAVALKGLAGRKVRALLTAFAVVIGVAMVSGTFVLTDTIQKAFDGIFAASYEKTDAVIAGKEIVKGSPSGSRDRSRVAARRGPGAARGRGGRRRDRAATSPTTAEIFGRDGKAVGPARRVGLGNDAAQPQFSPLKLKTGDWAARARSRSSSTPARPPSRTSGSATPSRRRRSAAKRRYEVTGIATFGGVDSLGGATIAVWDLPTAQTLLDKRGPLRQHLDRRQGRHLVRPSSSAPSSRWSPRAWRSRTRQQQAAADAKDTNVIVDVDPTYFLLGFGAIALFVGAFVIFNTLSITVAQRTREFATLRTLGASRKQVMRSVVIEGLVIGLLASVIGLVRRARARQGLTRCSPRSAATCRRPAMVFAPRTVLVSLAARHRGHAAGEHRAGAARDPRAADRGGPRGLDAAALALRRRTR